MNVYHGSSIGQLTTIVPSISTHGKPYIYASTKKEIAALFTAHWNDFIFNLSTISVDGVDTITFTERYEHALEEIYLNKSGYIYRLDSARFLVGQTGFEDEVVAEEAATVLEEQKIEDVYSYIHGLENSGRIKIHRYPDKPDFIPEDDEDLVNLATALTPHAGMEIIDYCIKLHPHLEARLKERV